MKKCLYCGNDFEPTKPKQIYCSSKHRTYAFRKTKKKLSKKSESKKEIPLQPKSKWKVTEVLKPPPGLTVNQQILWKAQQKKLKNK